jgi:hypothetical protein
MTVAGLVCRSSRAFSVLRLVPPGLKGTRILAIWTFKDKPRVIFLRFGFTRVLRTAASDNIWRARSMSTSWRRV